MKVGYIQMILKPSPEQQAALEQLLQDQQDPASLDFHKWLTPEQFADQFGTSANDILTLETWLKSQGFTLIQTARARNWIAFSGTASQVQNGLNTEIRHYLVDGETHYANATAPSIPAAFSGVVRSFVGLNDFRMKARPRITKRLGSLPQFDNSNGAHFLAPGDLSVIYDTNPLYKLGINGTGEKIVIIGLTDIILSDIASFRSTFGLPTNNLTATLVPGSTDPGLDTDSLGEADLDLEWSGGMAPNAAQIYLYSSNILFSVNYAVDQNLAPVISMSLGVCESRASSYGIGAGDMQPIAQQANSQGTTILVSSGDSGAAMCDPHGNSSLPAASDGAAVNLFASPPETTGVGGTMFNEGNGSYWASGNGPGDVSALSYIPEVAWNENSASDGLLASGGGLSIVYGSPAWQSGVLHPAVNARAVPDVALTSAAGHDAYLIFTNGGFATVGGTSAAAPSFAGIVALVNQYTRSSGLGNINPNIYRLAQSTSGIFHDITSGNNIVPCVGGTPNCSLTGGSFGYNAVVGYDLVTGWGSVDAYNLATGWSTSQLQTAITVTANPPNFALNGSTTLTATVSGIGTGANPTGTVTFLLGNTSLGAATLSPSGSGASSASLTIFASQLPAGNDTIIVSYGGDKTFTPATTRITVGVSVPTGGSASAVIPSVSPNPVFQQTVNSQAIWYYTVRLTEVAGVSTTLTGLTIAGTNYSSDITSFFGSTGIPANGTLSASLQTTNLNAPTSLLFIFSGVDAGGRTWSQQATVQFLGPQLSALLTLTGLPNQVTLNSLNTEPNFPWCQDLGLEENNGHAVYLTKFLADGDDLSDQIADYFGGTYIPPFGSLLGGICWTIPTADLPYTISYEIDGIDDEGNAVFTTLSSQFVGQVPNPGTLQPSTSEVTLAVNPGQSATSRLNINVQPGQAWTVSTFPNNRTGSWLVVYPQSGTGSQTVNVSASSSGLAPGVYQATVVFQSATAIPESYDVQVNFVVGTPTVTQFLNGATITDTGISPGLIFAVRGTGLGPQYGENYFITENNLVTNNISGMQVFVDGYLSPLLYVSATQINAIAPYELASRIGQRVNIQVVNNGVAGNTYSETVVGTAPGIFNLGNNQAAIRNADGSINGPGNGAARGSYVAIYATGEGQLTPAGVDGSLANETTLAALPHPIAPVGVTFNGINAPNIAYDGTVPTSFEGFFQINVQVPATVPSGNVQVVFTVNGVASPPLIMVVK